MKETYFLISLVFCVFLAACNEKQCNDYESLNASSAWELSFSDECNGDWQDKWFLDGLIAKVENQRDGMNFSAGPVNRNNAHHAVLWTKESFKGDVKIEYNYTRTDSQVINVNILYIQAQGIGKEGKGKDIYAWRDFREVPTMSIYYEYMNPLHISYAAFPMVNTDPENDYIRVRKYPVNDTISFQDMEVEPSFYKTGLFLAGETYKITVIKTDEVLHFNVEGKDKNRIYSWHLKPGQSPKEGRIGLRHMFTRSAKYSDVKIYTK
jgi:hypothetical protein